MAFYMQHIYFYRGDKNSVSKETRNAFVKFKLRNKNIHFLAHVQHMCDVTDDLVTHV